MSTTKKVASPVVAKKPAKTVVKRARKVLASSEFAPLIEPKKPIQKLPKATSVKASRTKKIVTPVTKRPVLTEIERAQFQPRGSQAVRHLVALPRLSMSEQSVKIVSIASRSLGVCIACVGITYSLFGSNVLVSALSQTALVGAVATSTIAQLDCGDPINFTNADCANTVNKQPAPTIALEGDRTNLTGTVPILVNVPHASYVKVRVSNPSGTLAITAYAPMEKVGEGYFKRSLETASLAPGTYRLHVHITNFYNGYDRLDESTFTIPESTQTETQTTVDASTAITLPIEQPVITSVSTDRKEASDSFSVTVMANNVDKVTLSAVEVATKKIFNIGEATKQSGTTWTRTWKLGSIPNGEYRIRVRGLIANEVAEFDNLVVKKIPAPTLTTVVADPVIDIVEPTSKELKPSVTLSVLAPSPLRSMVGISIEVAHASSVILALQPKNSLRYSPLGRAIPSGSTTWIYRIDTATFPDGEYTLKATVRNQYGEYEVVKSGLIFKNVQVPVPTEAETTQIKTLSAIATELEESIVVPKVVSVRPAASSTTATTTTATLPAEPVPQEPADSTPTVRMSSDLESQLARELDTLSVAVRVEDADATARITERINALKGEITQESVNTASDVDVYIEKALTRTKEKVARASALIAERTTQKAAQDSDQDRISDYDEVRLYGTNPFVADTDNDGFLDGIEVESGYDPLNATPEVLVSHESPKEAGVIREDILKIKSITAAAVIAEAAPEVDPGTPAIISGVALPNSFITLYIFSTPIIVTIKTDNDGSWSYRLDKELEDGEHEMYIGVTDNAGKIVAKSSPFAFVKKAEAFTGIVVDTPATVNAADDNSLLSNYVVYLVLGISTVAIGLILMLLGVQLQSRKPEFSAADGTS